MLLRSASDSADDSTRVYSFRIGLGYAAGAGMCLRLRAQSREQAWARVLQMHPRAVDLDGLTVAERGSAEPSMASARISRIA